MDASLETWPTDELLDYLQDLAVEADAALMEGDDRVVNGSEDAIARVRAEILRRTRG